MSDEIIKKAPAPVFSAHAEGEGVAVGYANNFSPTFNLFLPGGEKTSASPEYFNLIMGYDPFASDHILVRRDRALTEYISDDVKAEFGGWGKEAVEKIKRLPTILSCEKDGTAGQKAVFGFIRDVKVQDNGIKVYFYRYTDIPFTFLSDNLYELAMHLFELTRIHWTIKRVDLLEVMQDAGLLPGR